MNSVIVEISLVLILLVANSVFAMTEIAIVSSRKGRLQGTADKGNSGAARALRLSESPNRFLSTLQIGITLVGIVAGAIGSGNVATQLAEVIAPLPVIGQYARPVSLAVVIGILTYLSLVVGELVPKRLAMKFPEASASAMAGPVRKGTAPTARSSRSSTAPSASNSASPPAPRAGPPLTSFFPSNKKPNSTTLPFKLVELEYLHPSLSLHLSSFQAFQPSHARPGAGIKDNLRNFFPQRFLQ